MWEDPIVAEVHRIREKLAAKYDFDVGAFFADLRARQELLGCKLIRQKRRVEPNGDVERDRQSGPTGHASSEPMPTT